MTVRSIITLPDKYQKWPFPLANVQNTHLH